MKWKGCKLIVILLLIGVFAIGCNDKKSETMNAPATSKEKAVKGKSSENKQKTEEQELTDSAGENFETGKVSESDAEQTTTVLNDFSEQVTVSNTNDTTSITQKNTTSSQKAEVHTHTWIEITQTTIHPEEGHSVSSIDKEWEKEHYAWRTFCNRCKDPETGEPLDITGHAVEHVAIVCGGGYYADHVIVKPYEGLPVMKEEWVVDKEAWTETVITGYQCNCGATKAVR